jgi:hypothetical protein
MKPSIDARQVLVIIAALGLFAIANVSAGAESSIDERLRSTIAAVRRAKTVSRRLEAAEHLVVLTDKCDCSAVTDDTIHSLVSLLDIDDDGVQMWVAAALGDFGIRAKEAVPKLLSIYSVSACLVLDRGSPATIPIALAKMGVTAPSPKCDRQ